MNDNSCGINDQGKNCCTPKVEAVEINLEEHWNNTYLNSPEEKLGWFESDLNPTLNLISRTDLKNSARILNVGAGSSTLIDDLLKKGHSNLIATDLSKVALKNLEDRLENGKVEFIIDDLTKPTQLKNIKPVDLWIDRAVLHFFTEKKDQDTYFDLLNNKVNHNGFALIAEYNLNGASTCAGLPVHRYSKEMLIKKLENNFELIEGFEYIYIMPSGAERPYIYTLFRKK